MTEERTQVVVHPAELRLLRLHEGNTQSEHDDELSNVISLLSEGRFVELFQQSMFSIFRHDNLEQFVKRFRQEISTLDEFPVRILTCAVSFLWYFIQQNFIGPIDETSATLKLFESTKDVSFLELDGENAYHLVRQPMCLYLAKLILVDNFDLIEQLASVHIWRQRYAIIHQQVLNEKVASLQDIVTKCSTVLERNSCLDPYEDLWMEVRLETAIANLEYLQTNNTEKALIDVSEKLGVTAELGGALGTRTHFQKNSIAQLVLKILRKNNTEKQPSPVPHIEDNLPTDISLEDDTVMDQIKFDQQQDVANLSCIEQALVLSMSLLRKRLNAPEELLDEEVMAYLNTVLHQPLLWTLQFSGLFQRSVLECVKSRKAERALSQYQMLLDTISKEKPTFRRRSRMFFISRFPTTWRLERDLANGYISLGLVKSALDIYLRLELWEEVVECYQRLQRNDRAEAIVRELLQTEQSPHLYCLLGDVTGDPSNYRIAWELSKQKSARAQRSWGYYHFQRKEYEEAVPHLRASLELNRLHYRAWQQLAFSCMSTERFEESVQAYKRVVTIDSDNFEAWNNMAKAYISLGDKEKAFRVLQESIKCNYEDWRIWENYLLVSMDVGAFGEVVKSWHRLIDIKQKHSDAKIARLLVQVVKENIKDFDGVPAASYLRPKLFELFARASGGIVNDADLWIAYGDLYVASEPSSDDGSAWEMHVQKMVTAYQKSLRCLTQKSGWEREAMTVMEAVEVCHKVWSELQNVAGRVSSEEKRRVEASLEMTIRNVIAMAKRGLEYQMNEQQREKMAERITQIEVLIKP